MFVVLDGNRKVIERASDRRNLSQSVGKNVILAPDHVTLGWVYSSGKWMAPVEAFMSIVMNGKGMSGATIDIISGKTIEAGIYFNRAGKKQTLSVEDIDVYPDGQLLPVELVQRGPQEVIMTVGPLTGQGKVKLRVEHKDNQVKPTWVGLRVKNG